MLLTKNVLISLGKSILVPFELTVPSASATDAATQMNVLGSGMTTLTISNPEMNDIMKITNPFEDAG